MNIISKLLKNRLALSTVVTTLIILVVSVLLAGVVTYFAINVTSTRVQEESLAMSKQHAWGCTDSGEGASSILVNFALNASGNSGSYYSEYTVNVTSSICINGYYTQLNESERQANLISTVLNEGNPAQAGNSVFF